MKLRPGLHGVWRVLLLALLSTSMIEHRERWQNVLNFKAYVRNITVHNSVDSRCFTVLFHIKHFNWLFQMETNKSATFHPFINLKDGLQKMP